jgi:putative selenate reductase
MTPIPFGELMNWILEERKQGSVFGIRRPYVAPKGKMLDLFSEHLETPFGPAAGPQTQLSQNLIAAYYAGCRFFELKTVQTLDGEDLPVSKPCILAEDECYNVEWSTELRVPEAFDEYVKAWYALKLISWEFDLGRPDRFIFNMSVGYNFEGITSEKIDTFIEGLKNASSTAIWEECRAWAKANLSRFSKVDAKYIDAISPNVCSSITLSTLHGCPPQEIERIASYLISKKGLNTFVKCNPTLLGYQFARKTMDDMGYDYLVFDDFHFCLLYTSPSPRDRTRSRMPSSA